MAVMSKEKPLYTVLVHYTVEPKDQAELIEVLQRAAPAFAPLPGFVSLTMHREVDGKGVVVSHLALLRVDR